MLTGADGLVTFAPAGTSKCLKTTDFATGTGHITVGADAGFRVGDPITFTVEGSATLDTALTAGGDYWVVGIPNPGEIVVSASEGGTAIATFNGEKRQL